MSSMEQPHVSSSAPVVVGKTRQGLPTVVELERSGPVLSPTSLGTAEDVLGLNLVRGCGHRCPFCSIRQTENDDCVYLYGRTAERLEDELTSRTQLPRAVFLSPGSDPFPPLLRVQEETVRVVELLGGRGIQAWIMTRGLILGPMVDRLARVAEHIKVTVPFATMDRRLQRALEPWAAPPVLRLRQIARLRERGIGVTAALDPLLPGVTDTRESLREMLTALARVGVKHVTAGYLFVRDGILERLGAALGSANAHASLAEEYRLGPLLSAPGLAVARYLPRARRQRGYAALISLAAEHGISVSISRTTNPDFEPPRPIATPERPTLVSLFLRSATASR